MRSDILPGARFPDDGLPDHTKVLRRLSDLQSDQTMVVDRTFTDMAGAIDPCASRSETGVSGPTHGQKGDAT